MKKQICIDGITFDCEVFVIKPKKHSKDSFGDIMGSWEGTIFASFKYRSFFQERPYILNTSLGSIYLLSANEYAGCSKCSVYDEVFFKGTGKPLFN